MFPGSSEVQELCFLSFLIAKVKIESPEPSLLALLFLCVRLAFSSYCNFLTIDGLYSKGEGDYSSSLLADTTWLILIL